MHGAGSGNDATHYREKYISRTQETMSFKTKQMHVELEYK